MRRRPVASAPRAGRAILTPVPLRAPASPPPPPRSAADYKRHIEAAEKAHSRATGKASARAKALKALEGHTREMARAGKLTAEDLDAVGARLAASAASLAALAEIQPSTGSLFVRLFLGQVNVREASSVDRAKLREEYEKFRFRTSFGFIVFPLIWIFTYVYLRHSWRYTHWIHILTHVWLLYYYTSLALRVNILRVVRDLRRVTAREHERAQPISTARSASPRTLRSAPPLRMAQ